MAITLSDHGRDRISRDKRLLREVDQLVSPGATSRNAVHLRGRPLFDQDLLDLAHPLAILLQRDLIVKLEDGLNPFRPCLP